MRGTESQVLDFLANETLYQLSYGPTFRTRLSTSKALLC
jgi:hypothetical protein